MHKELIPKLRQTSVGSMNYYQTNNGVWIAHLIIKATATNATEYLMLFPWIPQFVT